MVQLLPEKSVKKLPPGVLRDLKEQNKTRLMLGMPQLTLKLKKCFLCGTIFESVGNVTCGCVSHIPDLYPGA